MKTRLLGALVGLAISFALPTYAQQKETVDPQLIQKLYDTSQRPPVKPEAWGCEPLKAAVVVCRS
jgi:hypothetical protein